MHIKIISTPTHTKIFQNVLYENVTSCQFFLPRLYAIKYIVVTYLLLAYNIALFEITFNVFLAYNIALFEITFNVFPSSLYESLKILG